MEELLKYVLSRKFWFSIMAVIIGIVFYFIIKRFINKIIENNKNNERINKKKRTYARLFNNIFKYLMIIIVVVIVLQINGINVTSIIAGLGLVSVIAGLALQDALKDIIMGFNIIVDDYFSVGDVLQVNNVEGKVIELGLKATKMKDINTGNIYVVANRNISDALILSPQLDIDIPLPYEEPINKMEELLEKIVNEIAKFESVDKVEYKGLNQFGDSAIFYKLRINCNPELKPQVRRDVSRLIKVILDNNNVKIPYAQIEVHNK